jgi:hypothetical protein
MRLSICALILFVAVGLFMGCGSTTTDSNNQDPPEEQEETQLEPEALLTKLLDEGVSPEIDLQTYIQDTWSIQSFPITDVPTIEDAITVTLGADSAMDTFAVPPLFEYVEFIYEKPISGDGNSCVEFVSDAPDGAIMYGTTDRGFTVFDATIEYELVDTGFDPIIRFIIAGTFYPACCGTRLGACAESEFDPTTHEEQRISGFVIEGANKQGFVVQTNAYYVLFMKE